MLTSLQASGQHSLLINGLEGCSHLYTSQSLLLSVMLCIIASSWRDQTVMRLLVVAVLFVILVQMSCAAVLLFLLCSVLCAIFKMSIPSDAPATAKQVDDLLVDLLHRFAA